MAKGSSSNEISDQIEDRLDDLFGDDEGFPEFDEEPGDPKDYPLRELKSIVLSIEWEITDEVMAKFIDQVAELKNKYKKDKILLMFLQLLGTIGEYIKINKSKAHPDAFKILNSLFTQMNKVVQDNKLSEVDKKKLLSAELNKYKKLKTKLGPANVEEKPKKQTGVNQEKKPSNDIKTDNSDKTDLAAALSEIKKLIRAEFKALRADLKLLRQKK